MFEAHKYSHKSLSYMVFDSSIILSRKTALNKNFMRIWHSCRLFSLKRLSFNTCVSINVTAVSRNSSHSANYKREITQEREKKREGDRKEKSRIARYCARPTRWDVLYDDI